MNKSFQPTATDIASYVQIIDRNRNGKVNREELEEFIIRYFFNPNRVAWTTDWPHMLHIPFTNIMLAL